MYYHCYRQYLVQYALLRPQCQGTYLTPPLSLLIQYTSVAQPFCILETLNIVEESWRHTNPILHIGGGGGELDVLISNSIQ
jgi:hypothetical protein